MAKIGHRGILTYFWTDQSGENIPKPLHHRIKVVLCKRGCEENTSFLKNGTILTSGKNGRFARAMDPIHKWLLFYFCSVIVQISLPRLTLE